ncbi:ATP-binding protein [Streptomyces sp. WAC05374]|uniref:ATP-binding protein n=1 Tax=Streptomyces sp. WAC05374 TaxID=2487420 RepID=UPI000F8710F9|nr:ATP-binding protein [Streptomyces sp. WAC05374]RST19166.1 ATP-binding protein [Streptomyces sp. WAC05374]TDF38065.1 ATP-binding protein [Streptomyces sp. WAC05374]TDF53524.1 ATP-binding protein [Streptomyces sp. WAC05374]TDF59371.1 ATP-binding protein [Streptomyces sp. WAC05374]
MDPINRGPEDFGHDDRDGDGRPRTTRDDGPRPAFGQGGAPPGRVRTTQLVSGDLLLTVNPIDGSEIEPCPPGRRPEPPGRRTPEERADLTRAAGPPVPPGPAAPPLPLLERQEERERLVRLLSRGRSVRLTGPAGSGRTALLDAVAADCANLAPDGVVRLSGHHRTPTELLYELFATVHSSPAHRPDRAGLSAAVHGIGAVVVLDDLEFGGTALDELLDATPECAFLLAATPDVAAPSAESHLEEVFLSGLDRGSALELLERVVDRPLTDDEANWAGDLWFESEGLPLRFVQAGALLRQRDELRTPSDDDDEDNVFADGREAPLPSLGDGAAPAPLLASRLSEAARETLRFAVALGGEVPHQAHLPALVNDTHADSSVGELLRCGLLTPVGTRHRLAAGVMAQLVAKGYDGGAADRARTAAHHYAWWVGHPSVSPERAVTEADAVLAAMTALVKAAADGGPSAAPGDGAAVGTVFGGSGSPDTTDLADDEEEGYADAAVVLARSAAPAFAAGLHWGAWERALRTGAEAARLAGEVAEEAYFHHELGVLALCAGNLDRARAELEASIAMRGALADKRGTVAGRRALALVADRERGPLPGGRTAAGEEVPAARREESASPPGGVVAAVASAAPVPVTSGRPGPGGETETLVAREDPPARAAGPTTRRTILHGARRNLVAAGAGAILAAVLGTVVTLGATSGGDDGKGGSGRVTSDQSANEDGGDGGLDADVPAEDSTREPGGGDGGTGGTGGSGSGPAGSGTPGSSASPGETGTPATPSGDPSTTSGATPTTSGPGSSSPTSSGPTSGTPTTGGTTGGSTTGGTTTGGTTGGTTSGGTTSGGTTDGSTSGDTTTGGSTSGDTTGGSTSGDTTTGGSTSGDTTGGSTSGDTTSGAGGGTSSGGADGGTETSGAGGATQSAPATSSGPTPSGTAA